MGTEWICLQITYKETTEVSLVLRNDGSAICTSPLTAAVPTYMRQRRLSEAGYQCIFPHAPHMLPMTSTVVIDGHQVQISNGDRENARAWFVYSDVDYSDASLALKELPMVYHGLGPSVQRIREILETQVDDDCCILGFSQGATFGHILSILTHHANQSDHADPVIGTFAKIKKVILVSGFPHMHCIPLAECIRETIKDNIQVQSLHIYGEGDTSVPKSYSENLSNCFVHAEVYIHEKGHFIPHNKPLIDRVLQFLES